LGYSKGRKGHYKDDLFECHQRENRQYEVEDKSPKKKIHTGLDRRLRDFRIAQKRPTISEGIRQMRLTTPKKSPRIARKV